MNILKRIKQLIIKAFSAEAVDIKEVEPEAEAVDIKEV